MMRGGHGPTQLSLVTNWGAWDTYLLICYIIIYVACDNPVQDGKYHHNDILGV